MNALTLRYLGEQNRCFQGTGGRSQEHWVRGFLPAFQDTRSGIVYLSRFSDGQLAPIHVFDGLPEEAILERAPTRRVTRIKPSITAGFVRAGQFYTREQAARALRGTNDPLRFHEGQGTWERPKKWQRDLEKTRIVLV